MKKELVTGTTSTGFDFEVSTNLLDDMDFFKMLRASQDNLLYFVDIIEKMFGKEQADRLCEHVKDKEGFVSVEAVKNEYLEVLEALKGKKS